MNGLAVACRRVVHIYRAEAGDVVALAGRRPVHRAGRDAGAGRPVRLRQVDADRAARRADAAVRRAGQHRHVRHGQALRRGDLPAARHRDRRGAAGRRPQPAAVRDPAPQHLAGPAPRRRAPSGITLDDPDRILDLVGLAGQGQAQVGDLAPGARQRAALAVGIAAGPGLLLVDEPTSQLDTARPRRGGGTRWRR